MYDVIAIGDTTQDIFLKMSDASLQCDVSTDQCKICFDYADKIAVDTKTDIPAVGNAANHAIGISRMGLAAALYTVVGDDDQGHKTQEVLKKNGVAADYVVLDSEHGTNLSIVINHKSERTIFVYHEPRAYQLPDLAETKWIYLTSASGDGVDDLHAQVLEYLEKNPGVKMAFNPGTHQIHLGREGLMPLISRSALLFLNREEAADVMETETKAIPELMKMYHEAGVEVMIITDGPDGSYVSDGQSLWHAGIFDGPVIERTGAGDSYGSGFLSAIIKGRSLVDAMNWGNANSTSVVRYIGAREGLLTEEAVLKMIEENPGVRPREFTG